MRVQVPTVQLGQTELRVSRLGFGCWQLGGDWGPLDEQQAIAALRRARDHGIRCFDTARAYGFGRSEEILGRALVAELRSDRDAIVVATKGGMRLEGGRLVRDARPEALRGELEASLVALGIDYVDLYQLHWPDAATPAEATMAELQRFVREGKVRHVGVCNVSLDELDGLLPLGVVEAVQLPHSLLQREIESGVLKRCRERALGVLTYGPLAHGLLGGRLLHDTTFAEADWRRMSPAFAEQHLLHNLEVVRSLSVLAQELETTVAALSIAWALRGPGVHCVLVGTRAPGQLDAGLTALDLDLDERAWAEVEARAAPARSLSELHWSPQLRV